MTMPWLAVFCLCWSIAGPSLLRVEPQEKIDLQTAALVTFHLGGAPDWTEITENAIWVTNEQLHAIHRIDPTTNRLIATIQLPAAPCSGIVFAFGSLWVPTCGAIGALLRIDPAANQVSKTLAIRAADSEGGITASADSIWMATDSEGTLVRIDPIKNEVWQKVHVAEGSFNPKYGDGIVWVTGFKTGVLTPVDAHHGAVLTPIKVGPNPRFLTLGDGSVWTLNQLDGSVTRVDIKTRRVTATISAGIPGHGGEICYGGGAIWATVIGTPLTKINLRTNQVEKQWKGAGGDSVRFGHGNLWLTDLHAGLLWRLPVM
jgi:streptogramin lyase